MTDDLPRRALTEIIKKYGTSIIDEPRRLEALLRDYCAGNKREIYILICAQAENVPHDLLNDQSGLPAEISAARAVQRLTDNRALSQDAAAWGVETWAAALKLSIKIPRAVPAKPNIQPKVSGVQGKTSPSLAPPPSQAQPRNIQAQGWNDLPARYPGLFITAGIAFVLLLVGGLYWNLANRSTAPASLPQVVDAYTSGKAFYEKEKYTDAVNAYSTAIAGDEQYAEAYLGRGETFLAENNLTQAEADLSKAIELQPGNATAFLARGRLYVRQKKDLPALQDLTRAIELKDNLAEAHLLRGTIYQTRGEDEKALADFTRAIALDPQNATDTYLQRGILYAGQEEHAKAIQDFDQVLVKDKGNALAYYRRALSRSKILDMNGAITDMNSAIALDAHNGGYFYHRGLLYAATGEPDRAIDDFTSSIAVYPTNAGAYYQRALLRAKANELEDAINDFTQVIRLNNSPELVFNAYLARAYTRARLDDMEGAVYDAQRTVDLNENSAEAWNSVCWLGSLAGNPADVMEACDKAIELAPDNGNYRDSRGVARAMRGNYTGAMEDIKAFLAWKKSLGVADQDVEMRKSWLTLLQKRKNPITSGVIRSLLRQDTELTTPGEAEEDITKIDTGPKSPKCKTAEQAWQAASDGAVMVCVPAGEYAMGSSGSDPLAYPNEKPIHKVILDGFWIDRTEVTNSMFSRCVSEGVCNLPGEPKVQSARGQTGERPALVPWEEAQAYCRWAAKRLPTEAEWEKAARGDSGYLYPWGDDISCEKANYAGCTGDTRPVGSYPDSASPFGALDMAGNAWEWMQDWYAQDYYLISAEENPQGPETGERRVLRGGAWDSYEPNLRVTFRYGLGEGNQGFRCVQPAE